MDQQNPTNSDWGTGSAGSTGGGGTSLGGSADTGLGSGTSAGGFGVSSATDTGHCPTCGQSIRDGGLEQFLGRLGITDEMIDNLKTQFQNVDIDEYLNTARTYLRDGSTKAQTYAKEHPGQVAAGVAALAVGAGILFAALKREK